eukprot:scaffold2986_cov249-Pinguiococcus_pyrenoidosus.AAC.7
MQEALVAAEHLHDGPEVVDFQDGAGVNLARFYLQHNIPYDARSVLDGLIRRRPIKVDACPVHDGLLVRVDVRHAVGPDVDLHAEAVFEGSLDRVRAAPKAPLLVRMELHHLDDRHVILENLPVHVDGAFHGIENPVTPLPCVGLDAVEDDVQRHPVGQLHVKLHGRDPVSAAGNLEVHLSVMVLQSLDICEELERPEGLHQVLHVNCVLGFLAVPFEPQSALLEVAD